jgi:plastocyanin domain-containing protein
MKIIPKKYYIDNEKFYEEMVNFLNLCSQAKLEGKERPTPVAGSTAPTVTGGVQEIAMKVTRSGYEPSNLTIKAGVPVRWHVDGAGAIGCTSQLVVPDLNITKSLSRGDNIIEFTAPNRGQLAFSCSMGMVRGSFTVL